MNRHAKMVRILRVLVVSLFVIGLLLVSGRVIDPAYDFEVWIVTRLAGLLLVIPGVIWLLYSLVRSVLVRKGSQRRRLLSVYAVVLLGSLLTAVVFSEPVSAGHLRLKWALGQRNFVKLHLRSSADLQGANLSEANLRWASLYFADLRGADLSGADLSGADLTRADLNGADLSGADLSGADLRQAILWHVTLNDRTQLDAKWQMVCAIFNERLPRRDLRGADLADAFLSGAALTDAELAGADLRRANLEQAHLSRADLSEADLSGAILLDADLSWANLEGANLTDANLRGANLTGAKLPEGWTAP